MSSVSVVIPAHNAAGTLDLQLEALARQRQAPKFDVLIVDNGSKEALDPLVLRWRKVLDIRVIRAVAHQGVAYARNVGLVNARGEFVIFLDADDCAGPDFVAAAVAELATVDFLTGNVVPLEPSVFHDGRDAVWRALDGALSKSGGTCVDVEGPYPIYMGGASAVRRQAAIALGGFDQAFVPGAEDNDFGLRILAAGHALRRCNGMALGERRRMTSQQAFRRSYAGGRMHMRLCAAYDLWAVSPHLREPLWWADLLRLPAAGLKTLRPGSGGTARQGWAGRAGLRLGQGSGFLRYRVRRRIGAPQLRLGFDEISQ